MRHVLPFVVASAVACQTAPEGPTWYKDVEPIVQQKCQGCHTEGGIGPMALKSYQEASLYAPLIRQKVVDRVMPPWPPSKKSVPIANDRSLSDGQIDTIVKWANAGAPEGDAEDRVNIPPFWPQIRTDLEVVMTEPYVPRADLDDDYRCFIFTPGLQQDRRVTGVDIIPGNAATVHHVILYLILDQGDATDQLARLDAAESGPGYTCFGGPGVDWNGGGALPPLRMLSGWAPGAGPALMPEGTGIPMPKGSRIVMQVHYNALNGREPDVTAARLQLAAPLEGIKDALIWPMLNQSFRVAPGAKDVVVTDEVDIGPVPYLPFVLYGVTPHMHVRGSAISVTHVRAGVETVLVDIPDWDFHWQGGYRLATSLQTQSGDKLKLRCVFDNSPENQPYVNGAQVTPTELRWGEGTHDEMCLAFFYATF